jgi:arginine utilization regulatory protein
MYREFMELLSGCGLGALLVTGDDLILDINPAGDALLHGGGQLKGTLLGETAPFLCAPAEEERFGNPAFNEYLLPCPVPDVPGLPSNTRLLVFRPATKDFRHDLLEVALKHVSEAITIFDRDARMLMINDAAEKLEAHLSEDVLGKQGSTLFKPGKNSVLAVPLALSERRPILNLRQEFVTHLGKELQVVSNSYPMLKGGETLGAVCMQENLSSLDALHQRIAELQSAIIGEKDGPSVKRDDALSAKYHFRDIVYTGPAVRKLIERCRLIARSDSAVMIYGETGTGKELFAQSIHNASRRKGRPFIAINCAAIPESLLEGILFGTEKGAYTGSTQRKGLLEQAHMGTLLLDEINSMDLQLQSKLLRFLQDGVIRRVGGLDNIHVDVRVISNINIPPMQAIEENLLRRDLYYRLGVVNLTIPPLRERREDIPLLVKTFLLAGNRKVEKNVEGIDNAALEIFYAYDWPGNVRELQHAVEYALNILPYDADTITPEYIPDHILDAVNYRCGESPALPFQGNKIKSATQEAVRRLILQTLAEQGGNVSKTAGALGVTRQNLQHYMKSLKIHADDVFQQ